MRDDDQDFLRRLEAAKSFSYTPSSAMSAGTELRTPHASRSKFDNAGRWLNGLVCVAVLAAVGGVAWRHRASLSAGAGEVRQRTSNPVDFALWLSGSDHTVADVIAESQRQSAAVFEEMQPAYLDSDFQNVDLGKIFQTPPELQQFDSQRR
jgi:hypothetical protein